MAYNEDQPRDESGRWTSDGGEDNQNINVGGKSVSVPQAVRDASIDKYYDKNTLDKLQSFRKMGQEHREKYPGYNEASIAREELNGPNWEEKAASLPQTASQLEFYRSGLYNRDDPKFNVGWRYGSAPDSGISQNFKDDIREPGISFMQLGDEKKTSGTYEMFNGHDVNSIHWYAGFENHSRGSDGEPLMVAVREIKPESDKIFNMMNDLRKSRK